MERPASTRVFTSKSRSGLLAKFMLLNRLELRKYLLTEDIFVSPNGLDDRYYDRKSKVGRDIDITYIATFEKRKNHRYLMRALSKYSGNERIKLCLSNNF